MLDWIFENKEWLFSGIGVAILIVFVGWLSKRHSSKSDVRLSESLKRGPAILQVISVTAMKLSQTVARLDVKMMNIGDTVAFTKKLNVKVKKLNYYVPVVRPSGKYDLEITNDKKNSLSISHKIAPNDVDRVILDVSFTDNYWYWSLLLTVEITYNDKQIAVSAPVGVRIF